VVVEESVCGGEAGGGDGAVRVAQWRARVDVERVEVSGIAIEGHTLEFVIEDYLRPTFPDVVVNEWFGLRFGVERFTVAPGGVTVNVGAGRK
jgi:hypothetical protein